MGHDLHTEASLIYRNIFKREIPPFVESRFLKVSEKINQKYPAIKVKNHYKKIAKINDLEALELSGRYLKKHHILSEKFLAMVYIAETIPENYSLFINEKNSIFNGYLSMIFASINTFYKLIKGVFLTMFVKDDQ